MTDTRKQIIELIEPYMDKNLSRWVIFSNPYQDHKYLYEYISESKKKWERSIVFYDRYWNTRDYRWGEIKILWHYDITAVLKYIDNISIENYQILLEKFWDEFLVFTDDKYEWREFLEYWENYWWLPNKPLHLYTEEEDKDLLKLLKKLWPINNSKEA